VPPENPLYLFRGTLTSATATASNVHVIAATPSDEAPDGAVADQTFTVGGETIFLLWQGKVADRDRRLEARRGDKIIVRVRAPKGFEPRAGRATAANQ